MNGQEDLAEACRNWWRTGIIAMRPGEIRIRGYPIEQLVGRLSFAEMIWLVTRGEVPEAGRVRLLEAALVAAVDHGPQAPSIAIARMGVSCGIGLNHAMASALNVLGDVHGGACEQAMELHARVAAGIAAGRPLEAAAAAAVADWERDHGRYLPGFGHRFHPVDPRAPRLLELVEAAAREGLVEGGVAAIARAVENLLETRRGRPVPLNIDGAVAVVFAELGFPPPLARGLFCLSRSLGILAHAFEQMQAGERNKGPTPPECFWVYDGPPPRDYVSGTGNAEGGSEGPPAPATKQNEEARR